MAKISKTQKVSTVNNIKSLFLLGFGISLGSIAAQIIVVGLGVLLFISGRKMQKEDDNKILGQFLIIIGMILIAPFALGTVLSMTDEIDI
tara:strand:- start:449 stop:718 length:270 start_codon:yes stop_codon:yes gene_type:complete